MSDGAHEGMSAKAALGVILGGDTPPDKKQMSAEEMRAFLETGKADDPYSEASRQTGALILIFLDEYPKFRYLMADDKYDFNLDKRGAITYLGLSSALELAGYKFDDGLTGFMWGWAVNAAKYAAGAPPVRNPALLTIGE